MQHDHVEPAVDGVRHADSRDRMPAPRLRHDHAIEGGNAVASARLRRNRGKIIGIAPVRTRASGRRCGMCKLAARYARCEPRTANSDMAVVDHDRLARPPLAATWIWRSRRSLALAALSWQRWRHRFSETYQRGYVVPEGALEQIPLGASQEQVLIVLGTPSTVATVSGEAFYYISQRAERTVAFMPRRSSISGLSRSISTRTAGRTARRLRPEGRQDVRLCQPDHADRRQGTATTSTTCSRRHRSGSIGRFGAAYKIGLRPNHEALVCVSGPTGAVLIRVRAIGCSVRQHRQQQQRHDVGDLDHRVDGRAGRVLVGIADGVAGHRRLVGSEPLPP